MSEVELFVGRVILIPIHIPDVAQGYYAHVCRIICFGGRGCQLSDYISLDEKYSKLQIHQNLIQYIMILVLTIIAFVCMSTI